LYHIYNSQRVVEHRPACSSWDAVEGKHGSLAQTADVDPTGISPSDVYYAYKDMVAVAVKAGLNILGDSTGNR
jgi:hypothetical protein